MKPVNSADLATVLRRVLAERLRHSSPPGDLAIDAAPDADTVPLGLPPTGVSGTGDPQ